MLPLDRFTAWKVLGKWYIQDTLLKNKVKVEKLLKRL